MIVYAWVNDADSKRTYGSRTDAYAVFKRLLDRGNPPDDWTALRKAAQDRSARSRRERAVPTRGGKGRRRG